jgi:hypothetical protein
VDGLAPGIDPDWFGASRTTDGSDQPRQLPQVHQGTPQVIGMQDECTRKMVTGDLTAVAWSRPYYYEMEEFVAILLRRGRAEAKVHMDPDAYGWPKIQCDR